MNYNRSHLIFGQTGRKWLKAGVLCFQHKCIQLDIATCFVTCLKTIFHPRVVAHLFFYRNNHNMKEFSLNLETIQKILLAGWRLFYFHLKSHIISCNCMSYHHDHVTYTAAPLFVCGDTPSIHCTLAGHQKVCSHGKHISVLLFWHRQNQAIEHA